MKKNLAWLAGALMALAVGCGGSQKPDPAAPPPSDPTMSPAQPPPGDPSAPPAKPDQPQPPPK